VKNNSHREYFANIRAPKYGFKGSFVVHVFMGPFTEDYRQRPFDPNLVGSLHVFATNIETTGCANCKKGAEQNLAVTGSVPLTSALLERIAEVGSLEPQLVEPYLKQNMHWRIHHVPPPRTPPLSSSPANNTSRRTTKPTTTSTVAPVARI